MRIAIATVLLCVCVAQHASAAELKIPKTEVLVPPAVQPVRVQPPRYLQQGLYFELGGRYWLASGSFTKDLFGLDGTLVSRLTYSGLVSHSAELFGSVKQIDGVFLNWNFGKGKTVSGTLTDEDFGLPVPPFPSAYSRTISDQREGSLGYATLDVGYNLLSLNSVQVGPFAGFNFFRDTVKAAGCIQQAGNTAICNPPSPTGALLIRERADWYSVRLGFAADWTPFYRFKLSANVAWAPFVKLFSEDTHTIRFDIPGPVPETASGSGVQLEGVASYALSDSFNVGIGARYWYLQAHGSADFDAVLREGLPQPAHFKTDRYGMFLQAAYTFAVPGRYRKSQWLSCC